MTEHLHAESLGRWAKRCGVSYRTAWRWFRNGTLPKNVEGEQMPTGAILIRDGRIARQEPQNTNEAVIYARINPRQSKSLLDEQVELCRAFCVARGWTISKLIREGAPAVGVQRSKLIRLIEEHPRRVVIATPSVMSRFDFRLVEALWQCTDSELIVVDRSDEIAGRGGALEDLVDAMNITCHRHYGPKRGAALIDLLNRVIQGTLPV